jgi:toxin ParE1/3/4
MDRIEKETFFKKIEASVIIRKSAEIEILEAFVWYEDQEKNLGVKFLSSIDDALMAITKNPGAYQIIHKNLHRFLLRKFPYAIYYLIEENKIILLACFHQKRASLKF